MTHNLPDQCFAVWVDKDVCNGQGCCAEVFEDVFVMEGGKARIRNPIDDSSLWLEAGQNLVAIVYGDVADDVLMFAVNRCPTRAIIIP